MRVGIQQLWVQKQTPDLAVRGEVCFRCGVNINAPNSHWRTTNRYIYLRANSDIRSQMLGHSTKWVLFGYLVYKLLKKCIDDANFYYVLSDVLKYIYIFDKN